MACSWRTSATAVLLWLKGGTPLKVSHTACFHTKFRNYQFRHSSNIKVFTSTFSETAVLVLRRKGFIRCGVETASGGMVHIPSFVKIGTGSQKFIKRDTNTDTQGVRWSLKPTFIFSNKKVGWNAYTEYILISLIITTSSISPIVHFQHNELHRIYFETKTF
jgi:hypothetical protein